MPTLYGPQNWQTSSFFYSDTNYLAFLIFLKTGTKMITSYSIRRVGRRCNCIRGWDSYWHLWRVLVLAFAAGIINYIRGGDYYLHE